MLLAKIENGIIGKIDDHRFMFPNISFALNGVDDQFCVDNSVLQVIDNLEYDYTIQKLIGIEPEIIGNKLYRVKVVDKSQEELNEYKQSLYSSQVVSMRQARLALLEYNLLEVVNNIVSNSDETTKITWEFSTQVERLNPLVLTIAENLNWGEDQLNELFECAMRK